LVGVVYSSLICGPDRHGLLWTHQDLVESVSRGSAVYGSSRW